MRARTLCGRVGCANLTPCPTHTYVARPWAPRPNRLPSHIRYKGLSRRVRLQVLSEEPTCMLCHQAPSTVVDHKDNRLPPPMRHSRANLQGACVRCNSNKSKHEAKQSRLMPTVNLK